MAPWLPGVVFYPGKLGLAPDHIVECLLAQINAHLLEPLSRVSQDSPEPAGAEPTSRPSLRDTLWNGLRKLVAERGRALLIIDALDELDRTAPFAEVLSRELPRGCGGILTSRNEPKLVDQVQYELRPRAHKGIRGLEAADVEAIVRQVAGATDASWCSELRDVSGGSALHIRSAVRALRDEGGNTARVKPKTSLQGLLKRRAKFWRNPDVARPRLDPLRQCLFMLSLFEPVDRVAFSVAARFLRRRGIDGIDGDELRELLEPVSSDLLGVNERSIKLVTAPMAEYVRESLLEGPDLVEFLEAVVQWLDEDPAVEGALRARFLLHWADRSRGEAARKVARGLIDRPIARKDAKRLFELYGEGARGVETLSEVTVECLRSAAELDHAPAEFLLGSRLLDGWGVSVDATEGERRLRRAVEAEDPNATAALGFRLIDGRGLEKSGAEGESLVMKAIELGCTEAANRLGYRKFVGLGMDADPQEGWRLLLAAAEKDDVAAYALAWQVDSGFVVPPVPVDTERLRSRLRTKHPDRCKGLDSMLARTVPHHIRRGGATSVGSVSDQGLEPLREGAAGGHPIALAMLGAVLATSEDSAQRDEGFAWSMKAIRAGVQEARWTGMVALSGLEAGKPEIRRLALLGDSYAAMLALHDVGALDLATARSLFETAAKGGMPGAQCWCALFRFPEAGTEDERQALLAEAFDAYRRVPGFQGALPPEHKAVIGLRFVTATNQAIRTAGLQMIVEAVAQGGAGVLAFVLRMAKDVEEVRLWLSPVAPTPALDLVVMVALADLLLCDAGVDEDRLTFCCQWLGEHFSLATHAPLVLELDRRGLWRGSMPNGFGAGERESIELVSTVFDRALRVVAAAPEDEAAWEAADSILRGAVGGDTRIDARSAIRFWLQLDVNKLPVAAVVLTWWIDCFFPTFEFALEHKASWGKLAREGGLRFRTGS